jgi:hypothetical protein
VQGDTGNPYEPPRVEAHATSAGTVPARPLGLWITTVYVAVFTGLMPMLTNVRYIVAGHGDLISPLRLVLSIIMAAWLVVFAVGAWYGSSAMRYGLVLGVLLQAGIRTSQNLTELGPATDVARMGGRIGGTVIIALAVVTYLLANRHANAFFARHRVPISN